MGKPHPAFVRGTSGNVAAQYLPNGALKLKNKFISTLPGFQSGSFDNAKLVSEKLEYK